MGSGSFVDIYIFLQKYYSLGSLHSLFVLWFLKSTQVYGPQNEKSGVSFNDTLVNFWLWKAVYCVQGVSEKQCIVYKVSLKSSVLCTRCLWKAVYCVQGVSEKQCTVYKVSLKSSVLCTRCLWKAVYCVQCVSEKQCTVYKMYLKKVCLLFRLCLRNIVQMC